MNRADVPTTLQPPAANRTGDRAAATRSRDGAGVVILDRIDPDSLWPARLTGPHAWHPWGLTVTAPDDRQIRLTLPDTVDQQRLTDRILTSIVEQLRRPTWPPEPPPGIHRTAGRLTVTADGTSSVAVIVVESTSLHHNTSSEPAAEVVTRDGWPVIDELAALQDRIAAIDPVNPTAEDLRDLAGWVGTKMTQRPTPSTTQPIAELLRRQATYAPRSTARLRNILNRPAASCPRRPEDEAALTYLKAHLDVARSAPGPSLAGASQDTSKRVGALSGRGR